MSDLLLHKGEIQFVFFFLRKKSILSSLPLLGTGTFFYLFLENGVGRFYFERVPNPRKRGGPLMH